MECFWWWFPWVSIWDMTNNKLITKTKETLSEIGIKKSNVKLIKKWSLLFSFKLSVWKVAFAWTDLYTNEAIACFEEWNPDVDLQYLYYCLPIYALKNWRTNNYWAALLNKDILQNMEIPLPPLATQRAIAEKLDKLQSLIDLKKQAITKTDELTKSIFLEMFGDPMKNEKGWEIEILDDICDVRDGTHDSPKYVLEWYPLITSKNIKEWTIDFTDANLISEEDYEKVNRRSKVDDGDILMPMIWTIWNPIIVNKDRDFAIKNVALIKFDNDKIINVYLLALLKSHYFDSLVSNNRGWTQKFVALSDIRNFRIPLPPLPLQQKFADIITHIEAQKSEHKLSLAKLEELYQAEMQKSFSL